MNTVFSNSKEKSSEVKQIVDNKSLFFLLLFSSLFIYYTSISLLFYSEDISSLKLNKLAKVLSLETKFINKFIKKFIQVIYY